MRSLTAVEEANLHWFREAGQDFSVLELTVTGSRKSLIDANSDLRDFLKRNSIHDYSTQIQGVEHKVQLHAQLVLPTGHIIDSRASLNRPKSGNGDPRIWFRGLPLLCRPWQKFAILWEGDQFQIHNISEARLDTAGFAEVTSDQGDDQGDRWSALGSLWDRATGGRDVAARPIDDLQHWPVARRAAGVDEALEWVRESFDFAGVPRLLFLVGGPGAGKSHAAAALVGGQVRVGMQNDGLAQRKYRYQCSARQLVLINDATISSDEHAESALSQETASAIARGDAFMACVNRGVLVEEAFRSIVNLSIGTQIVDWVHSPERYSNSLLSEDEQEGPVIITDVDETYFRTGRVMVGQEVKAEVVVVFVDACSLLEKSPVVHREVGFGLEESWFASRYRISELNRRSEIGAMDTPAGDLLGRVIGRLSGTKLSSDSDLLDPFAANLKSLRNPAVQSGLLSILRSTEIATGTGFTFREIWGVIARVIVGNATEREVAASARKLIERLQPKTTEPLDRFAQIQHLAALRFSQALYGVGRDDPTAPTEPGANPVTRLTHAIDPVRDSTPGRFSSTDTNTGWATPIVEAFTGPVTSGSPLETLRSTLEEGDPFLDAIDTFDLEIDRAFVSASSVDKLPDALRNQMIAWYGRYITRLYATANGIPAFRREIALWTKAWAMSPALPTALDECLRTLLRPVQEAGKGSSSMIPVFDSRTTPVIGIVSVPRLALETQSFGLLSKSDGEGLFLTVTEAAIPSPRIRLDFALVRQAMSCTAGWIGFTEVSDDTSPRLERFRSSRLVPSQLGESPTFVVLDAAKQYKVQVGRS